MEKKAHEILVYLLKARVSELRNKMKVNIQTRYDLRCKYNVFSDELDKIEIGLSIINVNHSFESEDENGTN